MAVSLKTDLRFPESGQQGHGTRIIQLPDKNQNIYVYCRSGNRSKQASARLAELGYTNIIEFGGINDYSGEIEKGRQ